LSLPFIIGIFIGGGTGSVLRHMLGIWLNGRTTLPLGTLAANLIATALLATITLKLAARWPDGHALPAALAIGLCGGFSTFSTFSADNHRLIAEGHWSWAAINVAVSVLGCLAIFAIIAGTIRR
jgi:CrcB protein